ncbi:flagellar motor stator protein MotA [Vibrio campbellii]|uniref:Flagellar motor stator protein MotA n=1 Tax=Vibrio campbellii TaxID=680 RepID=A0ABY5IHI4_9VIBR|nr:flagellar motor stator protein MotA [Vibrio campbellii]ARV75047.1 flagellar motor stator protein MotA [Vibrio campbellii CAIM 519 = NBRC 15631 = ATCC 25920]ELU51802.1 flagellar motor protein MotA [Vibrio campbellii CAIM 519 = NBRC 15631 = ATCC 25920]UTZ24122.1 flagellar motor stator protein MotA [Vibrio campbellii]UTZ33742.1 flagellar motor stator protein MotA [Vibrio campbellii]HDM8044394.1 flagellar motor stator protein MotA [Vibrio campbellii]
MQKFFGAITVLICVFGGYIWAGGKLGAIWQPAEFLIIVGAAAGSLIIGNPPQVLKEMRQQISATISGPRQEYEYYMELMALLNNLLETARGRGFKFLDSHIESPEQSSIFLAYPQISGDHRLISFITDNLRLMAMGQMSPHELEGLLEQEIEAIQTEMLLPSRSMQRTAEALPGFGILAAVGGIIITMQAIDGSIALIGYHVAAALVGTFIGIFGCYCCLDPLSNAMAQRVRRNMTAFECVRATLVAYVAKKPTLLAIDAGRKHIQLDIKPTFNQMEKWLAEQEG